MSPCCNIYQPALHVERMACQHRASSGSQVRTDSRCSPRAKSGSAVMEPSTCPKCPKPTAASSPVGPTTTSAVPSPKPFRFESMVNAIYQSKTVPFIVLFSAFLPSNAIYAIYRSNIALFAAFSYVLLTNKSKTTQFFYSISYLLLKPSIGRNLYCLLYFSCVTC